MIEIYDLARYPHIFFFSDVAKFYNFNRFLGFRFLHSRLSIIREASEESSRGSSPTFSRYRSGSERSTPDQSPRRSLSRSSSPLRKEPASSSETHRSSKSHRRRDNRNRFCLHSTFSVQLCINSFLQNNKMAANNFKMASQ